ncbi:MAG: ABC transporter permease subunit [Starkeya sp.]|nr:ABC transporter permease subunit [Starkeya sp.]
MTQSLPKLRLGTRGSPLALWQAHAVRDALLKAHRWPDEAVEVQVIRTTGDAITDRALSEAGGKGLFTKELEEALLDRRIDLAARGMGAGIVQRIVHVILPNIGFGVATAALLVFVLSWEEIGVTLFITSVDAITLPRLMWMGLRDNVDPAVAAISVVLIVVTTLILLVRMALQRRPDFEEE